MLWTIWGLHVTQTPLQTALCKALLALLFVYSFFLSTFLDACSVTFSCFDRSLVVYHSLNIEPMKQQIVLFFSVLLLFSFLASARLLEPPKGPRQGNYMTSNTILYILFIFVFVHLRLEQLDMIQVRRKWRSMITLFLSHPLS